MSKQQHSDEHRWRLGRDEIGTDGTTYMRRWFFWCPWFGIRVHNILRSDHDRHLHDHPWDFVSLILRGGYQEITEEPHDAGPCQAVFRSRRFAPGSIVRHRAEDLHRLIVARPAWTIVITGPKRKSWGFMTEDGMVPWREYLARQGAGR